MTGPPAIPDADRVVRYVPWSRLRRDEDDKVIGINPEALQLRAVPDSQSGWEEYLSVSWIEYFPNNGSQLEDCIRTMRLARQAGAKSFFAVANVGLLKKIALAHSVKVRVLHEPSGTDPSHAAIRRLPPDNLTLLATLAEEAFLEIVANCDVP